MKYWTCLAFALLLLAGCAGEEVTLAEYEVFERPQWKDEILRGHLGQQTAEAKLTLRNGALSGNLQLLRSGTNLKVEGQVSFEGMTRGKIRGGEQEATFQGIMLTPQIFRVVYQNFTSTSELALQVGSVAVAPPEKLEVPPGPKLEIEWEAWERRVYCIRSNGDTTGTVSWMIPSFPRGATEQPDALLLHLHEGLFYRPECTCKALDREQTHASTTRVTAFTQKDRLLEMTLQIDYAGKSSRSRRLQMNLDDFSVEELN